MSEGQTILSFIPTWCYLPLSFPPFCLALPALTQFSDWLHSSLGSLSASITGYRCCPSALCTCSFQSLLPHHLTCGLHPSSVDAPVDVHGISHNFLFFHPREALLVGCQVTTLPIFLLWHPISITSDRGSLVWGGAGTPVPCMTCYIWVFIYIIIWKLCYYLILCLSIRVLKLST